MKKKKYRLKQEVKDTLKAISFGLVIIVLVIFINDNLKLKKTAPVQISSLIKYL